MNPELKANKQIIRNFMREHYTDERLTMLLAHAQSDKLTFHSCCCFIGIVNAPHALQGSQWYMTDSDEKIKHLDAMRLVPGARNAEAAFLHLCDDDLFDEGTAAHRQRIRRFIPIVKAEIRRRDRLASVKSGVAESAQTKCEPLLIASCLH